MPWSISYPSERNCPPALIANYARSPPQRPHRTAASPVRANGCRAGQTCPTPHGSQRPLPFGSFRSARPMSLAAVGQSPDKPTGEDRQQRSVALPGPFGVLARHGTGPIRNATAFEWASRMVSNAVSLHDARRGVLRTIPIGIRSDGKPHGRCAVLRACASCFVLAVRRAGTARDGRAFAMQTRSSRRLGWIRTPCRCTAARCATRRLAGWLLDQATTFPPVKKHQKSLSALCTT